MKVWETIRLLLAYQHAYERLTKISSKQKEQKRCIAVLKEKMENMNVEIQSLDEEIASICEDEKAKDIEILGLQGQIGKLKEKLARARSNTRYQEGVRRRGPGKE